MRRILRAATAMALALALAAGLLGEARAQTRYSVRDLGAGSPEFTNGIPSALNDAGVAVGQVGDALGNRSARFNLDGTVTVIGLPGYVGGINADGTMSLNVIYQSRFDGDVPPPPVSYRVKADGTRTLLPPPFSGAAGPINAAGVLVGGPALRFEVNNTVTPLTGLLAVADINDLGTTVGLTEGPFLTSLATRREADGTIRVLGTRPDQIAGVPMALNNGRVAVGYAIIGGASSGRQALRWGIDGAAALLAPPDWYSVANDINDAGVAVGQAYDPQFSGGAYRFNADGTRTNLNAALDASGAGWNLVEAMAINASGQVVGYGSRAGNANVLRAFLLTPTGGDAPPPAATLASLAIAPISLVGGASAVGTVTLSAAAPVGGASVSLAVSAAAVGLPPRVSVPAGAKVATFAITTKAVTAVVHAVATATYAGVAKTATLELKPAPRADAVTITRADYAAGNKRLNVEATSTDPTATLRVLVKSSQAFIGTLTNRGGGRYSGEFTWPNNPQAITVKSTLGGSADRAVTAH